MIDIEQVYRLTGSSNYHMDKEGITSAIRTILQGIGENLERDDLDKTPERTALMLEEVLSGYFTDPMSIVEGASIPDDGDQMIIARDITFYSMCEHHLLPFMGKVHVAFQPDGHIIGLSRIPKIVDLFAHRLTLQERLTTQIAEFINLLIQPKGVAVFIEGFHLCASMRGVKQQDLRLNTSCMLGFYKGDPLARMEVAQMIARNS